MKDEERKLHEQHEVEIFFPAASPSKDFMLKIDGKRIRGVRDVKISAPFQDATTITIEMLAHVKGKVEVEKVNIKEKEST